MADKLASKTTEELRALGLATPELRPAIVAILRQREADKMTAIAHRLTN